MRRGEKCLMVRTPDERLFFTELDNFPLLIEFSKTVGAEVSVVKPQEPVEVLPLARMARLVCNAGFSQAGAKVEVVECKIARSAPRQLPGRRRVVEQAQEIRKFIAEKLKGGQAISVPEVEARFPQCGLGQSSLRRHLSFVRRQLAQQGHTVFREGIGRYRLTK